MISISSKGNYGLAAMVELAKHYGEKSLSIGQIAKSRNIPQNYLEQLLVVLKKSGLVRSFRGAQGGYALAKAPADIYVKEVLEYLEGPISLSDDKSLDWFWCEAEDKIGKIFDVTLESVVLQSLENEQRSIYSI